MSIPEAEIPAERGARKAGGSRQPMQFPSTEIGGRDSPDHALRRLGKERPLHRFLRNETHGPSLAPLSRIWESIAGS